MSTALVNKDVQHYELGRIHYNHFKYQAVQQQIAEIHQVTKHGNIVVANVCTVDLAKKIVELLNNELKQHN